VIGNLIRGFPTTSRYVLNYIERETKILKNLSMNSLNVGSFMQMTYIPRSFHRQLTEIETVGVQLMWQTVWHSPHEEWLYLKRTRRIGSKELKVDIALNFNWKADLFSQAWLVSISYFVSVQMY